MPIRLIVVYLTAIASILFVFLTILSFLQGSSESPVRDLARTAALPFALGIVPAMVLALMNRMLPLALLLIGFAVLFGVYAFANLP